MKIGNPKLIVTVRSNRRIDDCIETVSVFDTRVDDYWTEEQIDERNIGWFLSVQEMKEILNWNVNGDDGKYKFKWVKTVNGISEGRAYVYDVPNWVCDNWYCNIIQDSDGSYYCQMYVKDKEVDVLSQNVDTYESLRKAIMEKTGKDIRPMSGKMWDERGTKKLAYAHG